MDAGVLVAAFNDMWKQIVKERQDILNAHDPNSPFPYESGEVSGQESSALALAALSEGDEVQEDEIASILKAYGRVKKDMLIWDFVLRGLSGVRHSKDNGISFIAGPVMKKLAEENPSHPLFEGLNANGGKRTGSRQSVAKAEGA